MNMLCFFWVRGHAWAALECFIDIGLWHREPTAPACVSRRGDLKVYRSRIQFAEPGKEQV